MLLTMKHILFISLFITLVGCSNTYPKLVDQQYIDLSSLNIILPMNWYLDTADSMHYSFKDDNGETRGGLFSSEYVEDFDFDYVNPNHSTIISDEYIDIPLGKCRLFTLDADNGTAASGITGTHNAYYAVITIKDKLIYIFDFSKNDKESQTKQLFIDLLKSIKWVDKMLVLTEG